MSEVDFDALWRILREAPAHRPWMTARRIAKMSGSNACRIERLFLEHLETAKPPRIRYSTLPSRRSLEVLWGDLEKVGQRPLPNITKDDVADETLQAFGSLDDAHVFFSHSHRDYDAVIEISRRLLERDVVPWLAETHIGQGEHIHDEIIAAMKASQRLLLFLSPFALDSRWTGKEYANARAHGKRIFVVADTRHALIRDIVKSMDDHRSLSPAGLSSLKSGARVFVRDLLQDTDALLQIFAPPEEFSEREAPLRQLRPFGELAAALKED